MAASLLTLLQQMKTSNEQAVEAVRVVSGFQTGSVLQLLLPHHKFSVLPLPISARS